MFNRYYHIHPASSPDFVCQLSLNGDSRCQGRDEQIPQSGVGNARRSGPGCHGSLNSIGFDTQQRTEQHPFPTQFSFFSLLLGEGCENISAGQISGRRHRSILLELIVDCVTPRGAFCGTLLLSLFFSLLYSANMQGQAAQRKTQADPEAQVQELFQAARLAEKSGDLESAASNYRAVIKLLPDVAEVHHNLGLVYYLQKKDQEAIETFQTALKLKPDLPGLSLFLGMAYLRTNQYEKAIEPLKKAIAQNSNENRAYLNLGLCYTETGRHEEAMKVLQDGLEHFPQDIDILYYLGRVYSKLMTNTFKKMADINPDSFRVHQLLGEAYEERREIQSAIEEYKRALERQPEAIGLNYALANLYWKEGSLEEAEKGFRKELELNPENYLATWKLGNIYMIRHETDQALPYLLKALKQKPDLGQAHRDLGRAYANKGEFDKAIEHYKIVIQQVPDEPTVHYRLALVYKRLGMKEEEQNEMAIFQKLKAAYEKRQKTGTRAEGGVQEEEPERSKKDKDIESEGK